MKHLIFSVALLTLALLPTLGAAAEPPSRTDKAGAAAAVPETFVADAPAGRHDTVAQVTMDDGARLWVKVLGDDPTKPLLIVHHGAPGVSSHLEPEASFGFLADRYRVLVFDARGSGVSDLREPYSHVRWVEDVDQLRRWAGADRFVLAGGSYGTFVSLEYALRYPEHLEAVILRGPSADGPSTLHNGLEAALKGVPEDKERQTRLWKGQARDDEDLKKGFEEFAGVFAPPPDKMLPASEKAAPSAHPFPPIFHAATHDWAFSKNLPVYDVRERLASIHVPMLVTVGRYDQVTVPAGAELIAQRVPGAKLVVFEHAGHSVPADEPAKFHEMVNRFLDPIYEQEQKQPAHFQADKAKEATSGPLYDTVARLDSDLFAAFNAHDVERLMAMFSPDVEFYHDTGGLTGYRQTRENSLEIFAHSPDIQRTLIPGSLEVYPINDYGAIEIGEHRFCHQENGKEDCGTFKFVHIWRKEGDTWKLTRVISYGH